MGWEHDTGCNIYWNSSLFHHVVCIEYSNINGEHSFSLPNQATSHQPMMNCCNLRHFWLTNISINTTPIFTKQILIWSTRTVFFFEMAKTVTTMKSHSEIWNSHRRAFIPNFHVFFVVHRSVDANFQYHYLVDSCSLNWKDKWCSPLRFEYPIQTTWWKSDEFWYILQPVSHSHPILKLKNIFVLFT